MRIFFFSIPAHGHTNPMLPVAAELTRRGHAVRFYSFGEFKEKIEKTGAMFVACDRFLGALSKEEEGRLKTVSPTEMTVQDIRITIEMNGFLEEEFTAFRPDVVFTDSVCFWGKLAAKKYGVPMVVSTSTMAFNRLSSGYMKNSVRELFDMIGGLPRIARALKNLEPYGYTVKNPLELVQNDNATDTVVYTSETFQPYAKSFSSRYAFVGPSVFSNVQPEKEKARPLLYISLGTVINERPDFYKTAIRALSDLPIDVIISCGRATDIAALGTLPENVKLFPHVDQLAVLSKADVFITHCGMNSVSESLYMGTPMVLFPETGEQHAVAKRVEEMGAGKLLKAETAAEIRKTVEEILNTPSYREVAAECSRDFRTAGGPAKAADFIETAPHENAEDPLARIGKTLRTFRLSYWALVIFLLFALSLLTRGTYIWLGVLAALLSHPFEKKVLAWAYKKL